jgi:hypothetical protein
MHILGGEINSVGCAYNLSLEAGPSGCEKIGYKIEAGLTNGLNLKSGLSKVDHRGSQVRTIPSGRPMPADTQEYHSPQPDCPDTIGRTV